MIMKRYRVQTRWFRKPLIVLQVGTAMRTTCDDELAPRSQQNKPYIHWQDATLEDLSESIPIKDIGDDGYEDTTNRK